ncbi:STM3941 family protein [Cypionkella sp.]|uniref:STM3941 family protein n=1 Tax=Cypionkella sp. TaxID=2811411 RepID=UPI00261D6424|nr:STM3941 family protein [Cypionkella sp.]MDB5666759.1 hypothetical protein [Cypionkella sp.]
MQTLGLGQTTIRRSCPKIIGLLLVAIVFIALGILLIYVSLGNPERRKILFFGWLSVLFFGMCSGLVLYRLFYASKTPVIFSPTGLIDKRSFIGEIPWSAIARVSVFSTPRSSLIRLELVSYGSYRLQLSRSGKFVRSMGKLFNMDGLYISSSEIDISFPELWSLMRSYVKEFCPRALQSDN